MAGSGPERLFTWNPQRNYLRWDAAVYTDDGEDIILWDGMPLDEEVQLNLMKPRPGRMTDFLYTPLLKLFVSEAALQVIGNADVSGVRAHRLNIRDHEGRLLHEYFWINVAKIVHLMDLERSAYQRREHAGFKRIDRLVIRPEAVPKDDLFLMDEIAGAVFSERLVQAIRKARLTGIQFEALDETFRWPV
jgi:hypothetical protein